MDNNNKSDTALALAVAALDAPVKAAAPLVEVEVILPVVVGQHELSLDDCIDRLAEIQNEERALKKEKDPIRKATQATLRAHGIETHSTPNGASATTYEQTRNNVDKVYLGTILTPEQFERAFPPKESKGMRVR